MTGDWSWGYGTHFLGRICHGIVKLRVLLKRVIVVGGVRRRDRNENQGGIKNKQKKEKLVAP